MFMVLNMTQLMKGLTEPKNKIIFFLGVIKFLMFAAYFCGFNV